jgi:hypothetical protein
MLLALLLVFHSLLAYGLTTSAVFGGVLLFGVAARFGGTRKALAAACSLAAGTVILAAVITLGGLDQRYNTRPHDVLRTHDATTGLKCYRKDETVRMDAVVGDMTGMTAEPIARSRSILFRTDELGYRNDRPFRGQPFLVVGDSFVVGVGNSQADILTEQLAARYAPDYYNLGHPGDLLDYEAMVAAFPSTEPEVLLFLFEGNDFPEELEPADPDGRNVLARYVRLFRDTGMFRLLRTWRKTLTTPAWDRDSEPVLIERTSAGTIAFYLPYVHVSERAVAPHPPEIEAILRRMSGRIRAVFFVPTKYRVYRPVLRPDEPLPHAQWEYLSALCERLDLRCIDLTPALVRRSLELWQAGRLTYWPDDTHWSAEGIAVAAAEVHKQVGSPRPVSASR